MKYQALFSLGKKVPGFCLCDWDLRVKPKETKTGKTTCFRISGSVRGSSETLVFIVISFENLINLYHSMCIFSRQHMDDIFSYIS